MDSYDNMTSFSLSSSSTSSLSSSSSSSVSSARTTSTPFGSGKLDDLQSATVSVDSWGIFDDVLGNSLALMVSNKGFRLDETLVSLMNWKFWLSSFLSVYCVIGNLLLITFLLSVQEYRTWQFFPIFLQALTDLIGAGISNAVYEWKFSKYWPKSMNIWIRLNTTNFIALGAFLPIFAPKGIEFCVLNYLRQLLNDFSTGLCIVTTAYYRYILVCHPTYDLTDKFCLKMALGMVTVIVLAFVGNTLDLLFNFSYHTIKFR